MSIGAVETRRHFLLECTRFDNLRQSILNNLSHLSPPSLNILLFGKQELSDAINKQRHCSLLYFKIKMTSSTIIFVQRHMFSYVSSV